MRLNNGRQTQRKTHGNASSIEFITALSAFFLVILFPLINLMGLAISAGTICLLTHQIATRVSTQQTYPAALQAMTDECSNLANTGFANFLKLQRKGGYQNCGCNLYVQASSVGAATTKLYGPNTPVPPPIDAADNVYEYVASTSFTVKPLIPMDGIPIVKDIPGIGQSVTITWSADRAAEYVLGLATIGSGASSSVATVGLDAFAGPPPPPSWNGGPSGANGGWRNPTIYTMINSAGETVISDNVILVPANNPQWTQTNISIRTGDKIWIDTQAIGKWKTGPGGWCPLLDANGYPSFAAWLATNPLADPTKLTNSSLPCVSLDGKIGASGTPFFLGDDRYNYPIGGNGTLSMINNDLVGMYSDNTGEQLVRVIVTR